MSGTIESSIPTEEIRLAVNGAVLVEAQHQVSVSPECFFLQGTRGSLFAMYYGAPSDVATRGSLVYVHPFQQEMYRSRHVIAAMCRKLAGSGRSVLTVDSYGCGDSAGASDDARWEIWREDLGVAVEWMQQRSRAPISLWGLRLGALLAMDYARNASAELEEIIIWQPLLRGDTVTNAFIQPAAVDLRGRQRRVDTTGSPGPRLAPGLVTALEKLELAALGLELRVPLRWITFASDGSETLTPALAAVVAHWKSQDVAVCNRVISGSSFWIHPERQTEALVQRLAREFA